MKVYSVFNYIDNRIERHHSMILGVSVLLFVVGAAIYVGMQFVPISAKYICLGLMPYMQLPYIVAAGVSIGILIFASTVFFCKLFNNVPIVKQLIAKISPVWNVIIGIVGFLRSYVLCFLLLSVVMFIAMACDRRIAMLNGIATMFVIHTIMVILLSTRFNEKFINKWYEKSILNIGGGMIFSRDIFRCVIYLMYFIGIIVVGYLNLEREITETTKMLTNALLSSFAAYIAFDNAASLIRQIRNRKSDVKS